MKQPFKLMSVTTPAMHDPEPTTTRAGIRQRNRLKRRLSLRPRSTGIFVPRLG
jgi:hypothetical protein